MKLKWEKYFLPYILERGRKCVKEGRVHSIRETNRGYEAVVEGEEMYRVTLEMENEKITQMTCNCFYVRNKGAHCKHMAAVLYELEAKEERNEKKRRDYQYELEEMIERLPKEETKKFLFHMAQEFPEFDRELRVFFRGQVFEGELEKRKKEIDQIFDRYADSYGFMDDKKTGEFYDEIQVFFRNEIDSMVRYERRKETFELISYFFKRLCTTEMNEENGIFSLLSDKCLLYLHKILKKENDEKTEKEIYEWIQECISAPISDLIKRKFYDFLMDHFQNIVFLEKKLEILDEYIKTEMSAQEEWTKRNLGRDAVRRLQIMKQLSYSEESCRVYQNKFWNLPEMRQMEIRNQTEAGAYDKAEKLILESCKIDEKDLECQERYCRQLADIYQLQGKVEEYRRQLIKYFLLYHQDSIELWRKIRSTFGSEEWFISRKRILQEIYLPYCRQKIMAEEKMFLELTEELEKEKQLDALDRYEKILRKKYPEKMLSLYTDCLIRMAPTAKGREKYRDMAMHLQMMRRYPGGTERTDQILKDWKKRYNRKKALMEELEKIK